MGFAAISAAMREGCIMRHSCHGTDGHVAGRIGCGGCDLVRGRAGCVDNGDGGTDLRCGACVLDSIDTWEKRIARALDGIRMAHACRVLVETDNAVDTAGMTCLSSDTARVRAWRKQRITAR